CFKYLYFFAKKRNGIIVGSPSLVGLSSKIGRKVKLGSRTRFSGEIGDYSFIGNDCNFPLTKIGKYSSIANDVKLIAGTHPISSYISTSPFFYSNRCRRDRLKPESRKSFKEFKYTCPKNKYLLEIGSDVWIGQRASILNGVTIGDGAIIGACALVTKDIPPFAIVVGVPAKIIGYRFDMEKIEYLNKIKWWNKDNKWMSKNFSKFSDVNE
ncbi:CatB-related O-acetyltransferase, partial [Vibrio vulnificus]|nr:CatB-related O-acetyltransferase [Vibrio vulnificus]